MAKNPIKRAIEKRKEKKAENKSQRKERRKERRQERRADRKENRKEKREARLERIKARQAGKTDRTEARQEAREEINVAKWEAKETAYENGIDPDQWKGKAIDNVGGIISGIVGGNNRQPMGFPDEPYGGELLDNPNWGDQIPFYMKPLNWLLAIGLYLLFKPKRKKRYA